MNVYYNNFQGICSEQIKEIISEMYGMKPTRAERFMGLSQGRNSGVSWGAAYIPDRININDGVNFNSLNYDLNDPFFIGYIDYSWWLRGAGITAGVGQIQITWQNIDDMSPAGIGYEDIELGLWSSAGATGIQMDTTNTDWPTQMPKGSHKAFVVGTYAEVNVTASVGQIYAVFAISFDGFRFFMS